jgi:hypothetical protein
MIGYRFETSMCASGRGLGIPWLRVFGRRTSINPASIIGSNKTEKEKPQMREKRKSQKQSQPDIGAKRNTRLGHELHFYPHPQVVLTMIKVGRYM